MKKDLHPKWPEPPENLAQRLLHVLDVFEGHDSDMPVLRATQNQYAPHGEQHSWTGLTLGDLRTISDIMVGRVYTLADSDLGCQFLWTGDLGERKCCRCGTSLKEYHGEDCSKAIRK